jgi:hypothetical protein
MDDVSEPSTTPVRPPHVTIASGVVIAGSALVVLLMWDRISGLESLDTRTTLATYLVDSRLGHAGLDLSQLTMIVRVAAMATAGCATAMLILGWHVTKRSRSARLALTVLAGALVVTGLVSDWFVESVTATFWACGVGAAVVTLWLGPARLWFSDNPAAVRERPSERRDGPAAMPPLPPPPPPAQQPPPLQQPPPTQQPWPPHAWAPPSTSAYDARRPPQELRQRPPALLAACILTWCCTAFAAVVLAASAVALAHDSRSVLDEAYRQNPQLAEQGVTQHDLLVMLYVVIGVVLAGAAAAAGFAVLLYRGRRWALYALLVAAAGSTLFFLIGTLGSPIGLLPAVASAVTFVLLLRPEVRAWPVRR